MKIDLTSPNPALLSIFKDPNQMITLDTNFFIPPARKQSKRSIQYIQFEQLWLNPIFEVFPNLAIHESVYEEFQINSIKSYMDEKINEKPIQLYVHKDSLLSQEEHILRDSIEEKIYPLTRYDPLLDNRDDRGEVKSLSHIAVKGLLYFAAHDSNAIRLIEQAEVWNTGLDNIQAIKLYEIIYYLYKKQKSNKEFLRMLYKYQYYLTSRERELNPEWSKFIEGMDLIYLTDSQNL